MGVLGGWLGVWEQACRGSAKGFTEGPRDPQKLSRRALRGHLWESRAVMVTCLQFAGLWVAR